MPGDISYADTHGWDDIDKHFNDVMVWSQTAAYMPSWGNHEWGNESDPYPDDLRNYKGRFDLPNPYTSPGTPSISNYGEDWYWFDYGNTRFIAAPEPWSGAAADWQTKAGLVMDAAQSDPAITFIVTFSHRPAFSSGHHSDESWIKNASIALMNAHSKYVLHINGHSHNYERSCPIINTSGTCATTGQRGRESGAGRRRKRLPEHLESVPGAFLDGIPRHAAGADQADIQRNVNPGRIHLRPGRWRRSHQRPDRGYVPVRKRGRQLHHHVLINHR